MEERAAAEPPRSGGTDPTTMLVPSAPKVPTPMKMITKPVSRVG
ncbi:hypothetical protein B046DRAFT_03780 [Streptomyces sp. LamerLS-316]|nr:hypothetical protein B046DRAFT_03780 [Streptomyces sp. LamerLS-316]